MITVTWSDCPKGKMKGDFSHEMLRIVRNTAKRYVAHEVYRPLPERIEDKFRRR